jgi:hypothetical protein
MIAVDREDRDANVEVRVFIVDMAKPAGRGRGSLDARRNSTCFTKLGFRSSTHPEFNTIGWRIGRSTLKIFRMSSPSLSSRQTGAVQAISASFFTGRRRTKYAENWSFLAYSNNWFESRL